MNTYIFNGIVSPHWTPVETQNLRLDVQTRDGRSYNLALSVIGSYISLSTTLAEPVEDLATFKNEIMPLVRCIFDTIGYQVGRAIDVKLTTVLDTSNNMLMPFDDRVDELSRTQAERPSTIEELVPMACGSIALMDALRDLRQAIQYPNDTAFYCARAIESLVNTFRSSNSPDNTQSRNQAWSDFRQNLLVGQDVINRMRGISNAPRHGVRQELTGTKRVQHLRRAWKIMDRYISFLKNQKQPLQSDRYSELSESIINLPKDNTVS
jgi:hypothetical protein